MRTSTIFGCERKVKASTLSKSAEVSEAITRSEQKVLVSNSTLSKTAEVSDASLLSQREGLVNIGALSKQGS